MESKGVGFLERCLPAAASALRSCPCLTSASTRRSLSSSRSLCVSILRFSLSCSPALISSSKITPRSIATLYFESKSSKDDVVFLACLSKSSLATSISRNFIVIVRLVSRRVVISFWRAFWAEFASVLDCLYLV